MASLVSPHWEAVPADMQDLLTNLGQIDPVHPFYLAGGTALALRLGHRVSVDLDLFANIDLQAVSWEQVKAFAVSEARRLGQSWFDQAR